MAVSGSARAALAPGSRALVGVPDAVLADYDLAPGTAVNERTTWTARIDGQPIHLLP